MVSTHGEGLRAKVRAHRDEMRRMWLRPVRIWVPDVRSPRFAAEARRQSLAVAHGVHARRDQLFIDRIAVVTDLAVARPAPGARRAAGRSRRV